MIFSSRSDPVTNSEEIRIPTLCIFTRKLQQNGKIIFGAPQKGQYLKENI